MSTQANMNRVDGQFRSFLRRRCRLDRLNDTLLAYRLKQSLADGRTCLTLKPLALQLRKAAARMEAAAAVETSRSPSF